MKFARVNEVVLHYADDGPPAAPALLLVNSLGSDFRLWDEVAAILARRRRVVRFDKRGHGLSQYSGEALAIADYASDAAALLEHLRVDHADVLGLSVGGMVAMELCRLRPERVRSLALCDTAHKIGTAESWAARIGAIASGGIAAIEDGVTAGWVTQAYAKANGEAMAIWRAMLSRTQPAAYVAACEAIAAADLTQAAKAIAKPTLCIVGEADQSTPPALMRELAALIPGARLEILAGAAHLPCIEKPEAVAALVEAHLQGLPA